MHLKVLEKQDAKPNAAGGKKSKGLIEISETETKRIIQLFNDYLIIQMIRY